MALADGSDCLAIYDSDKADAYALAARFCGTLPYSDYNNKQTNPAPKTLVLHSGTAHFVWTTGSTGAAKGFSAAWAFTTKRSSGNTAVCGGDVITAATGYSVSYSWHVMRCDNMSAYIHRVSTWCCG